jgi:uncharacterized SAM-binding protein YcdF (DUF218 family)
VEGEAVLKKYSPRKKKRRPSRLRWILACVLVIVAITLWAVLARAFAPQGNTTVDHFDAIIVLGYPADSDGNPTPEQLARVSEAVREYDRGVAPRLILSGGAAHNHFVEAQSMARVARAQGVPESAIFLEPNAKDTIQNACYSARIMKEHNWGSAEVVSSPYHLPRAGLIFNHLPIEWHNHAAPPLEPDSAAMRWAINTVEVIKTARYLVYTQWAESCSP